MSDLSDYLPNYTAMELALDLSPVLAAALLGADFDVSRINLLDYSEDVNIIGSAGGGTQILDMELGNAISMTIDTSTTTLQYDNPSATGKLCGFICVMTNGGSQTVNYPAAQDWVGGTAPVWTTAGVDLFMNLCIDNGTIWMGAGLLDIK